MIIDKKIAKKQWKSMKDFLNVFWYGIDAILVHIYFGYVQIARWRIFEMNMRWWEMRYKCKINKYVGKIGKLPCIWVVYTILPKGALVLPRFEDRGQPPFLDKLYAGNLDVGWRSREGASAPPLDAHDLVTRWWLTAL